MTKTTKTESDGRARPPTSVVGPLAVSVVVHALLFVLLLSVALTVEPTDPRSRAIDDAFVISLDEPPPAPETIQINSTISVPLIETTQTAISLPTAADIVGSSTPTTLQAIGRGGGAVASLARAGSAQAPGVSFAGLRTKKAQRIVYVVDGSGSMVTSMPFVIEELLHSVQRLSNAQHFAVVLFRNQPPQHNDASTKNGARYDVFAAPDGSMLLADTRTKQRLRTWAHSVVPRGISNPSDGLARALSFNPDAVFLLARSIRRSGPNAGWGVGINEIMAELEKTNPRDAATNRRPATIKTIQFIDEDPTGTMQRIGDVHGTAQGESGYTLLTLPALEQIDHEPIAETLDQDAQIERAASILSALSATGRDTAALFGIGVNAEKTQAAREAARALRAANQSEATDTLATLVRARSRMILSASTDQPQINDAITELKALGESSPDVTKLNLAIAYLLRANAGDQTQATNTLASIDATALDPTSHAEFLMARVLAEMPGSRDDLLNQMAGPPFRTPQGLDGSLCAAAADTLARRAQSASDITQIADALEPWAELIRDGSINRDALLARAAAAAESVDRTAMPIEVAYAVGRAALNAQISRPDTIELLDHVAAQANHDWLELAALRDSALARVKAWEQTNDPSLALAAAKRLLSYVQAAPNAPDRAQMLTLSLGLCERLMVDANTPTTATRIETTYTAATALAITILPNEQGRSDRWICAYARQILDTADPSENNTARQRARTLLEQIGPTSPAAQDASKLGLYISVQITEELRDTMTRARTNRDESTLLKTATAILAECDRAAADAAANPGTLADYLAANKADALLETTKTADAAGALPIYTNLITRAATIPGGPPRLALGSARATLAAGNTAQAFASLRDLAKQLNRPAPNQPRQPEFWHAWTILLEISAANNRPVQAHIAKLSEIDPNLGGQPWRTRLNAANKD